MSCCCSFTINNYLMGFRTSNRPPSTWSAIENSFQEHINDLYTLFVNAFSLLPSLWNHNRIHFHEWAHRLKIEPRHTNCMWRLHSYIDIPTHVKCLQGKVYYSLAIYSTKDCLFCSKIVSVSLVEPVWLHPEKDFLSHSAGSIILVSYIHCLPIKHSLAF
jgi:hypothetical protein